MVHSKGFRRKSRRVLTKKKSKGLSSLLQDYNIDEKVVINIDPSQIKGMPHRRYHGRVGIIKELKRRSLLVNVPVGGKIKKIITRYEHVQPHLDGV